MYWALTHVEELQQKFQLTTEAGAKKLEEAGGKMMTALGKRRYEAAEHAAGAVTERAARARTAL